MIDIKSAKITAMPGQSGWAQVYEFTPQEPEIKKLRGSLYVLVATTNESLGIESMTESRRLFSKIHSEYFGELIKKPFDALKNSIETVVGEFSSSLKNLEIAACISLDGVIYVSAFGGARVLIHRDESYATILDSTDNVIAASGFSKSKDKILIATKQFFTKVSPEKIGVALNENELENISESFNSSIYGQENIGNLGAIVLGFDEDILFQDVESIPLMVEETKKEPLEKMTSELSNKISIFVGNIFKKLPERRIYVHSDMEDEVVTSNKKLTFSVGLILLIILAISIGFGARQKKINDTKKQYQAVLKQAQSQVDEAISLASVSPDRSRELFFDSEQKLIQIEALKVKDNQIDELRRKINDSKAAVLGQYEITPEFFLDLSLLSSGFKGDVLSLSDGNIFILDKQGLKVVSVAVSTKKSKVIAGPGVLDSAFDLTSYTDRTFILGTDGIYEVGSTKTKVVEKTWGGEALIKAFAGNLYVLDKSGNAIYRYAGNGNTYGEKQNWLTSSAKVDFSDAKEWVIDGSAYVLFPNSLIQKFSLGSPQSFKITGVFPEIGTIDSIYADADNQYVYFLDKAGKRIVVTDKKGKYKAQYQNSEIGNTTNLVVSEAEKKIILLSGDKLMSIDMKN